MNAKSGSSIAFMLVRAGRAVLTFLVGSGICGAQVAFTHIDLDKDLTQFVKSDLTAADASLLESHRDMVKASLEARRAFLRMVAEVV